MLIHEFGGLVFSLTGQLHDLNVYQKKVSTIQTTYTWGWLVESKLCWVPRSIRQNK